MNADAVKTVGDFVSFIKALLAREKYKASLEEYLRALWGFLSAKRDIKPDWSFMASSFETAFSAPVPDFDEAWMQYELPPALDAETPEDDFSLVEKMLLSQIADLRRMKNAGMLNQDPSILWMGIISPTKQSWYNFSPDSFLECASRWMEDARDDFNESRCTWFDLALFLEVGQLYE